MHSDQHHVSKSALCGSVFPPYSPFYETAVAASSVGAGWKARLNPSGTQRTRAGSPPIRLLTRSAGSRTGRPTRPPCRTPRSPRCSRARQSRAAGSTRPAIQHAIRERDARVRRWNTARRRTRRISSIVTASAPRSLSRESTILLVRHVCHTPRAGRRRRHRGVTS